jgi:hypothetical protein
MAETIGASPAVVPFTVSRKVEGSAEFTIAAKGRGKLEIRTENLAVVARVNERTWRVRVQSEDAPWFAVVVGGR